MPRPRAKPPKRGTDLFHESQIDILLAHEIARAQRYPVPLGLLRIAVVALTNTDAKTMDAATKVVSSHLGTSLRVADVAGRYGSEFVIILPATDEDGTFKVARRLLSLIAAEHVTLAGKVALSACIGVAELRVGQTLPHDTFILQATVALAEAKKYGPGSIVCFSEIEHAMSSR